MTLSPTAGGARLVSSSAALIWGLGLTQIVGYGTLYYSFSVLSPLMARSFSVGPEWISGLMSVGLLTSGLGAPLVGRQIDQRGARAVMTFGSVFAALALTIAALAPNLVVFGLGLIAMEMASAMALYAAAFAALVQCRGSGAQRAITHLTLIAGFASTLAWPLCSALITVWDWREIYLAFAVANLLICAPLHFVLIRGAAPSPVAVAPSPDTSVASEPTTAQLPAQNRRLGLVLLLGGFAIVGFLISGVLLQIMPLLEGLGLKGESLFISALFGPAQVLSRFTNMIFGRGLRQVHLAVLALLLPTLGLLCLAFGTPGLVAGIAFAVFFGFGSGISSIVSGSLPLELFGRDRYGERLGWISSARQIASATAPFAMALVLGHLGSGGALWTVIVVGALGAGLFFWVSRLSRPNS